MSANFSNLKKRFLSIFFFVCYLINLSSLCILFYRNFIKSKVISCLGIHIINLPTNVVCARVYLFKDMFFFVNFESGSREVVYKELISISRSHFVHSIRKDVTCSIRKIQSFVPVKYTLHQRTL